MAGRESLRPGTTLTHLFVGAEGTLGVLTEVTLRVYGIPEATGVAICSFPIVENCTAVVQSTLEAAVPISRLAECITLTKTDTGHEGVPAPIVGHVGDGNVHLAFVLPPGDGTVLAKAAAIKTGSLEKEHASAIPVMAAIKNALAATA